VLDGGLGPPENTQQTPDLTFKKISPDCVYLFSFPHLLPCPFRPLASSLLGIIIVFLQSLVLFVCAVIFVRLKLRALDFLTCLSSYTGRQSRKVLTSLSWLLVCAMFHLSVLN